jgi:hypothetical protein
VDVRILAESEYPAWREFVDRQPAGSVYSYAEYLDVLCRVAGGSFRILGAFRGDELHGGIGLYERPASGGTLLSGRLLLYYNGIVLKDFIGKYPSKNASRQLAVLGALAAALEKERYAHVQMRNRHAITDLRPFLQAGWSVRPSYSYLLNLEDPDEGYGRVDQNQRRLIRRCEEEGGTLTADDDFDAFFRVHTGTSDRKNAPLYLPEGRFKTYYQALSALGLGRLYQVRMKDGQPAASQLVLLGGHPVTHTAAAGAEPDFLNLGTTPFLRWKVGEALAEEGFKGNDLTDATLNEVTRFKSALGGDLVLNLVLGGRDSLAFQLHGLRKATYRRMRSAAGRVLRSLQGRVRR